MVRQLLEPVLGEGPHREGLLRDAGAARSVFDLAEEGRVDGFAVLAGLQRRRVAIARVAGGVRARVQERRVGGCACGCA